MHQLQLDFVCQRWRDRRGYFRPPDEVMRPAEFQVEQVGRSAAATFVCRHHYSRRHVASVVDVGLFWRRPGAAARTVLAGVCSFSNPMSPAAVTSNLGVAATEGLELGRLVLLDEPKFNAESWFVARAFRLLRTLRPETRAVVSYCDPVTLYVAGTQVRRGHVGTTYRALGACLMGRSRARTEFVGPDGLRLSERSLSKIRGEEAGADAYARHLAALGAPGRRAGESGASWLRRALKSGVFASFRHPGKWRFGFALGAVRERRLVEAGFTASLPYLAPGRQLLDL